MQQQNQWQQQVGSGPGHDRNIAGAVATAGVNERVEFVRKVYVHLFGAILGFAGLCYMFLGPLHDQVAVPMVQFAFQGAYNWLLFLGLFMVVGWVADKWARSDTSRGVQYLGLALYTLAEAVIFVPLLFIAQHYGGENTIQMAAITTILIFAGLTATVFVTRKDFSFMRGALGIATMGAFGLILASIFFGFSLGVIFSVAMVVLAGGYVLYYTSQILAHYHPQQYVAASLALFSAVALLFWYVIRIFMALRD